MVNFIRCFGFAKVNQLSNTGIPLQHSERKLNVTSKVQVPNKLNLNFRAKL